MDNLAQGFNLPGLGSVCFFNNNGWGWWRGWSGRRCNGTYNLSRGSWFSDFLGNKRQIRLLDNTYCWKNHIHLQDRAAMIIMAAQQLKLRIINDDPLNVRLDNIFSARLYYNVITFFSFHLIKFTDNLAKYFHRPQN